MEGNRIFKVASLPSNHVFEMNISANGDVTPLGGVEFRFLKLLAACMNFKYKVLVPEDGEFGKKTEGGNWTGMVGMALRGEADFGLNMIALNFPRSEAMNFSYPYMIDGTTFITEVPAALPKTLAYFYPFDEFVWLCLITVLIAAPLVFKCTLKTYPLSRLYFEIFGSFFQQPLNIHLRKMSQKILGGSWLIYSRLSIFFYTVVLLSFVTIPLMSKGLYTVNQVAQAAGQGTHKCYVFGGTADQDAFFSASDGPLNIIGKTIKKYNRLVKHGSHIKLYIPDSKTVLIGSNMLVPFNYLGAAYRNYFVSKDFFYITLFGIPVHKNFCCLKEMNKCIIRAFQAGLYQKFIKDELFMMFSTSLFQQKSEDGTEVLTVYDISGAFLILIGGYFLSIMTLLLEMYCLKKGNKGRAKP